MLPQTQTVVPAYASYAAATVAHAEGAVVGLQAQVHRPFWGKDRQPPFARFACPGPFSLKLFPGVTHLLVSASKSLRLGLLSACLGGSMSKLCRGRMVSPILFLTPAFHTYISNPLDVCFAFCCCCCFVCFCFVFVGGGACLFVCTPQWGAADAEIKIPSVENTELKCSPFKAWSRSVCSHTCCSYCHGFLPF